MAQQTINVGTVAGDNTGDPGRTAFQKVNSNFTELYVANTLAQQTNVKAYGAVGNGVADDTAAFVAAAATGLPVYVPPTANFYSLTSLSTSASALLYGEGTVKVAGATVAVPTAWKSPSVNTSTIFPNTAFSYSSQDGTAWQSQFHPNWNVVKSQITNNPTEWQVYTNAANGVCQTVGGTNQVVRQSGSAFTSAWIGLPFFYVGGTAYKVATVTDSNNLTVTTTGGGAVSWPSTATDTFYFCATTTTSTVNVSGTTVTYVSGQPFISFCDLIVLNGVQYTMASFSSPTSLTISSSAGTLNNVTMVQYVAINNELATFRLQGLQGANEENFSITLAPSATQIRSQYAGSGKYRPILIGSGENPAGTFNPHIGIYPNATLGAAGNLTLGGSSSNRAVLIPQNSTAVNYLQISGANTTVKPSIAARGSDSTVGLSIDVQGANNVNFTSNSFGNIEFQVFGSGGSSWLAVGSSTTDAPTFSANGASANIDIKLAPKGSGSVWLGAYTAGAPAATGFITVKDSSGVSRKLLTG